MNSLLLIAILLVLSAIGYQVGRKRALAGAGGQISGLHSLPSYYGSYVALWCALPALLVIGLWLGLLRRLSCPTSLRLSSCGLQCFNLSSTLGM